MSTDLGKDATGEHRPDDRDPEHVRPQPVGALRDSGVGIMLSTAQVEHVIGASLKKGPPSIAALLAGLHAGEAISRASLEAKYRTEMDAARLSHSLLRGLFVLALLMDGKEQRLSDMAKQLDMSVSTTHRYATTLLVFGLVEQDQSTRMYRLAAGLVSSSP